MPEPPKFEYVIIVIINENYLLDKLIELNWGQFLKYRKWRSRVRAWNLSITQKLINDTKVIYLRP
ncbi:hypothetical protein MY7_3720 [Bacillus sp. 5B6]|nr:hypothetical protein MY7_3720 [Bacillus sp. 5B6]